MRLSFFKNSTILLFAVLISGLFSVFLGKEISWDLANYHYYNPYAFFHQRWLVDYWPVSYPHVRFVPTLDILLYFLINTLSPLYTVFLLGAIHGLNIWLLFNIAYFFLSTEKNPHAFLYSLFITILGFYGPTAFTGMGSIQNDNFFSIFVLAFVWSQLHVLKTAQRHLKIEYRKIFLGGFLLGMGTALKLTASVFCIGAFCVYFFIFNSWKLRLKSVWFFSVGVMLGFVLFAGYWFWVLYQQSNYSLHLLLQSVFHSSHSSLFRFAPEFLPHGIMQVLFFPFYFSFKGNIGASFQDFRFIILYVLFVIYGVLYLKKLGNSDSTGGVNYLELWLLGFVFISYCAWEYFFSILRYIVAIEMLAPLLIYLLLSRLIPSKKIGNLVFILMGSFLLLTTQPIKLVRVPLYEKSYFNVNLPAVAKVQKKAMVLLAYPAYALNLEPRPQAYLIPFFPKEWRFIGIPFLNRDFFYEVQESKNIQKRIDQYNDPFYLLTTDVMLMELYKVAKKFGLKANGPCEKIKSDRQRFSSRAVILCPIVKYK